MARDNRTDPNRSVDEFEDAGDDDDGAGEIVSAQYDADRRMVVYTASYPDGTRIQGTITPQSFAQDAWLEASSMEELADELPGTSIDEVSE